MATPTQAKAIIDAAVVQAKSDIDNIIPATANMVGGSILFGPTQLLFILDAGGVSATTDSLLAAIKANLTTANRTFKVSGSRGRRGGDSPMTALKLVFITTDLAVYQIINIG